MRVIHFAILFSIVFILTLCVFVYAQDPILPEVDPMGWVNLLFSTSMAAMVASIVGITKLARNAINLKGTFAFVLTVVISLGYALIQYTSSHGFATALFVGVMAALVSTVGFRLTKLFGKKAIPNGIQ